MSPTKPEDQQPVSPAPQPSDPGVQYGPAPASEQTPYTQQPVNQQYFAQPQAAPVQYVVMAESLKGVKGWLLFFVICFALAGIGYISMFFAAMQDLSAASSIVTLVFAPVLATLYIATVVFVAMQKKLGKWLAIGSLGVGALYSVITSVAGYVTGSSNGSDAVGLIGGIVVGLVFQGLLVLYFFVSKRVKETLVA